MGYKRCLIVGAGLFFGSLFLLPLAEAGGLAKTVRAVKTVQDNNGRRSTPSPRPRPSRPSAPTPAPSPSTTTTTRPSRSAIVLASPVAMGSVTAMDTEAPCPGCTLRPRLSMPRVSFDLQSAMQTLRNSDSSVRFSGTFLVGRVGVHASAEQYKESISAKGANGPMSDDIRLQIYELSGVVRLVDQSWGQLDLRVGVAKNTSTHFDEMTGSTATLRTQFPLHEHIKLGAHVRGLSFSEEINAVDSSASLLLSYAKLGYRVLKYNVGPAIHGPELGFALSF